MRKTLYYGLSLMLSCVIMAAAPVYGASEGASSPKDEVSLQAKKTINGVVLDENGNPLAGATVLVKGSNAGSITDNEGRFAGLSVKETDYLEVSYLGYIDAEVAVKGKTSLTVTLQPNEAMEEVIVTGFQETKKESIVSAIETVNPKDLKVPSSNFTNALAGRVAGLISYQRSGEPGRDNSEFFIRGVTTFGYAQSPLIMVDGFETTSDALADIEPDNIESFSVLKDATAAALYGSKGANGVIVVTTKQGSEGKLSVSFRHESKISTPTQLPQTVDGVTYMKLFNSAQFNDNPLLPARYSTEKINNTINNVNPLAFPNVDWYDMMFKNATYNQHYTVNANGGGKIARYYMAVSYDKDTGILKENRTNNFKNNIDINRFNI
ncbi:MAG: SusC/RagA family TonB-linked outer membrane protein, partial [Tidjanibacter sp.]|nr:SusC/RagA family TonB-linked outer membrane protein [Tidjanibacter sp.]